MLDAFCQRQTLTNATAFIQWFSQAMHSAEEGQLDCKICKMMLSSQVSNCLTIYDRRSLRYCVT